MLVMIEDTETIDGVPPIIGNEIIDILFTPEAREIGDWRVYTPQNFSTIQPKHTTTVEEALDNLIHHQRWWGAIHVKKDATSRLYKAMMAGNTSYEAGNETWVAVVESGRDFQAVPNYVIKNCQSIQLMLMARQQELSGQVVNAVQANGGNVGDVLSKGWPVISQPLLLTIRDLEPVRQIDCSNPSGVDLYDYRYLFPISIVRRIA